MAVFRGRHSAFVAIPKSHEFAEVSSIISSSLADLNIEEVTAPLNFNPSLLEACKKADFVICDITENNPSTYYVIGASQASQKPVLLLCKESPATAPSEISGFKVVRYRPDNVSAISKFLHLFVSEFLPEAMAAGG